MEEKKNTIKQEAIADEQLAEVSGGDSSEVKNFPETQRVGWPGAMQRCPYCNKEFVELWKHTPTCPFKPKATFQGL